ncbi:MAG: hypothetical protein EVA89_34400 [Sandaracinaceae bacterium]|nr:MAG: hypothetical protein EVA89_34400 [Sandaracinaceae bacterium]
MRGIQVVLTDASAQMAAAWRERFDDPDIVVHERSLLDATSDAWVVPVGPDGAMDRGIASTVATFLGPSVPAALSKTVAEQGGAIPHGRALCLTTGKRTPRFLIAVALPDGADAEAVARATGAALLTVELRNGVDPGAIRSVALPRLAAPSLTPQACAHLMWLAHDVLKTHRIIDFSSLERAIRERTHAHQGSTTPAAPRANRKRRGSRPTLPDHAAAQAQLQKRLAQLRDEESRRDDED